MPRLGEAIPVLQVRDVVASVAFYAQRLGFTARYQEDGFAIVGRDATQLHLTQANDDTWRERSSLAQRPVVSGAESFLPGTDSCRIRVDDVDQLYTEYEVQGVIHPAGPLKDEWWGDRHFGVLDLDGNLLTFFQRRERNTDSPA